MGRHYPLRIDAYSHVVPPAYKATLEAGFPQECRLKVNGVPPLYDLDARFRIMDRYEGLVQVLTLGQPAIESIAHGAKAVELAQMANDGMAELVARYPERFVAAVACLPMDDVDEALTELDRAIKDLPDIEPFDDMREILKAQETRTVCSCTCRKRRTDLGMACEHSHDINCFQFNRGGEYALARGTGRQLSYEEALTLVDEIEQDGLVHNWRNDRNMSMPVMCNCCIDCCMIWHPVDTHKADIGKFWAKSRFEARVDQSLCTGCQACVDRCMFDAIEMVKVPGTKKLKAQIDPEKCFGCGACVLTCPPEALSMKTVRPPEFVPETSQMPGH